jgi:hypothetical protein
MSHFTKATSRNLFSPGALICILPFSIFWSKAQAGNNNRKTGISKQKLILHKGQFLNDHFANITIHVKILCGHTVSCWQSGDKCKMMFIYFIFSFSLLLILFIISIDINQQGGFNKHPLSSIEHTFACHQGHNLRTWHLSNNK